MPGRTILTSNANYYINNLTGSDGNSGSISHPFATLQRAWDRLSGTVDGASFTVGLNLAASATPYSLDASSHWLGTPFVAIKGAGSTKSTINDLSLFEVGLMPVTVNSVTLATAGGGFAGGAVAYVQDSFLQIGQEGHGTGTTDIIIDSSGFSGYATIYSYANGEVDLDNFGGSFTIKGNSPAFILADARSTVSVPFGGNFGVAGSPTFSTAFAVAQNGAVLVCNGAPVFSGGASGPRYLADTNGVINTGGGGEAFFPGNAAGVKTNGGVYI